MDGFCRLHSIVEKSAIVINAGCLYVFVNDYICGIIQVHGSSMAPTISDTSRRTCVFVAESISVARRKLQNGDVVNAVSPKNPDVQVCKRISAMAGEIVKKENGENVKVPKGHVWLLGDNSKFSVDSRNYGPVPYGLIKSRLVLQIYPFSMFGNLVK